MSRTGLRPWTAAAMVACAAGSLACDAGSLPARTVAPASTSYVGGIQVEEPDHARWANMLKDKGFNTVSATVYAKQGDWDSSKLWWKTAEPSVQSEIRAARAAHLQVVLILRVALDHAYERNRHMWHGMIWPDSDADFEQWLSRYRAYVVGWAKRAEALNVDVLGIGSELSSMTSTLQLSELPILYRYYLDEAQQQRELAEFLRHEIQIPKASLLAAGATTSDDLESYVTARRTAWRNWAVQVLRTPDDLSHINSRRERLERFWRELVQEVRRHFRGRLTYAANFDQYESVTFWDELDYIGINAYFRLRDPLKRPPASAPVLQDGWRKVLGTIQDHQRLHKLKQPVIFTELGYVRRDNSSLQPWSQAGFDLVGSEEDRRLFVWDQQHENREERAAAMKALAQVAPTEFKGLLRGILYWKLTTLALHEREEPFVLALEKDEADPMLKPLSSLTESLKN